MGSHYSDEEHERIMNDPETYTAAKHQEHILANYERDELIEIGYLGPDGNVIRPEMAVGIPRREHFPPIDSQKRWERQKAHLISVVKRRQAEEDQVKPGDTQH
jgi:hypothetical protein